MNELARNGDAPLAKSTMDVEIGRAAQEVQGMVLMAKHYPRDETRSLERIRMACRRPRLAEAGLYSFPRGGSRVEGLSIRAAEVMAQAWGNMDFGVVELKQADGESSMMAYAWDLETNVRVVKRFTAKHEMKARNAVKKLTDQRDIYEHTANLGARRLRACILGVIPGDVQDIALEEINATLRGDSNEPIEDRIRRMADAFKTKHNVTSEMLEEFLGHNLMATNEAELSRLRGIFQSLSDGMASREQFFDPKTSRAAATQTVADKIDAAGQATAGEQGSLLDGAPPTDKPF